MLLVELVGNERHTERVWRDHHSASKSDDSRQIWLTKNGKRLAGPFKDKDAAESFKKNRKDRIPHDAVVGA